MRERMRPEQACLGSAYIYYSMHFAQYSHYSLVNKNIGSSAEQSGIWMKNSYCSIVSSMVCHYNQLWSTEQLPYQLAKYIGYLHNCCQWHALVAFEGKVGEQKHLFVSPKKCLLYLLQHYSIKLIFLFFSFISGFFANLLALKM